MESLVARLPSSSFWQDRRVLVTGHTGFKGSWLTVWLDLMGANTFGLSLPPQEVSLFRQARLESKIEWANFGDVRHDAALHQALQSSQPEVIFHLAAQPLVLAGYVDPVSTIDTNVMGTVRLLDAARQYESVKAMVIVTTDKVYRNREVLHSYQETDELGAADPYSTSKAAADLLSQSFSYSFAHEMNMSISTARAGNVIGGGDWAKDRLIPDAVRAWSNGMEFIIRNPTSTRPWQHVLEPLCGYMLLAESLFSGVTASGAFNFGPALEDAWSVKDVVASAARHWPGSKYRAGEAVFGLKEAGLLHLDSKKAQEKLGYLPRWNLQDSIERTIRWYLDSMGDSDVRSRMLREIEEFISSKPAAVSSQ
jgi:CDP-glucose 4,6-dehydratase